VNWHRYLAGCLHLFALLAMGAHGAPLVAEENASPAWASAVQTIEEVTPRLLAEHKTPGVSIALVEAKKLIWAKGFGVGNAAIGEPVEVDTMFEACSMSKPLFAYAVLKLVEQQKLDLDRPLAQYLDKPYLADQPLHEKVTARMVLAHTTGFPNWRPGGWRSKGKLIVRFEPGTRYGYSGEGFLFLQRVVEHQVGETLEPWIQRTLLQPLAMNRSSYVWQPAYDKTAAAGHTASGEVRRSRTLYKNANSAYTLYTTPSDYARFLIEMLSADAAAEHSLQPATIDAMLTPQPILSSRVSEARGLGWAIATRPGDTYAYHTGSNPGFRCYSRFDRKAGSGIVIMTNAESGAKVWAGMVEALDAASGRQSDNSVAKD
jgi:CubicO group peptidase (beta-lactamase class C family)